MEEQVTAARTQEQLADHSFTERAYNVVLIDGPGTGKTHLAIAMGVAAITQHGRRVRVHSTVDSQCT